MRKEAAFTIVCLLTQGVLLCPPGTALAADIKLDPNAIRLPLTLHAGQHDRINVPVSVLIDAGAARSAWMLLPDGKHGRAQLSPPGLLHGASHPLGTKQLYFGVPKLAKGETLEVVALLSKLPIEGRHYVWTGEPRRNRRLSCSRCHQGVAYPTVEELRHERQVLDETGSPPPLELPYRYPTTRGRDFRWHPALQQYNPSSCWDCHGRHMVEYEFGRSVQSHVAAAPDPAQQMANSERAISIANNPFHQIFRTKGDYVFAAQPSDDANHTTPPCGLHYGFALPQRHRSTLSEESGKFVGRHTVLIDWRGFLSADPNSGGARTTIAREQRQLTVKNMRARNRSLALWIDFVSRLEPLYKPLQLTGQRPDRGFHFFPPIDASATPEYRASHEYQAITFIYGGVTYTAVCFNHPDNPVPIVVNPDDNLANRIDHGHAIGYRFNAETAPQTPLVVHYRLWIQEGRMPLEELRALSDNFLRPIRIEVQPAAQAPHPQATNAALSQ